MKSGINPIPINVVSTLEVGSTVAIVGVVYVEYPKKSNILAEISGQKVYDDWKEEYSINIEDETAKIGIDRKLCELTAAVTGLIVGIIGHIDKTGLIIPIDVVYPGIGSIRSNPITSKNIICLCDIPKSRMKLDLLKAAISSDVMRKSVSVKFYLRLERSY